MTLVRHALIALLMLSVASPALAQDEPLIGGEETPPTPPPPPQPTPPPPAPAPQPAAQPAAQPTAQPAAPAAEGAMTPRKKKDITDTDHDMVIGDIGLQVVYVHNLNEMQGGGTATPLKQTGSNTEAVADLGTKRYSGDSMANLGVRYWFTRKVGLDAGVGLWIHKPAVDDADVGVGFGIYAGVPFALGVYRHLVIFAGPDVGFAFHHQMEETNRWLFNLQGKAGIELSLGFMDIHRLSLMGTFSFGLRIYNNGNETELVLGNDQGFDVSGLFTTSVGLVFYI